MSFRFDHYVNDKREAKSGKRLLEVCLKIIYSQVCLSGKEILKTEVGHADLVVVGEQE